MSIIQNCSNDILVTCADPVSANCVYWPGDDISCIDVCVSKPVKLTHIVKTIGELVCELKEQTDVTTISLCENIQIVGEKNLNNLLQAIANFCCSINEKVDTVESSLEEQTVNLTLDFKCLTSSIDPCSEITPSDLQEVLQVIINNVCTVKESQTNIQEDIPNIIDDSISQYLDTLVYSDQPNRVIATSNPKRFKLRGFVPTRTYLPYDGPLTNFDSSGKGFGPMEGWYIANGNNGTKDMRGVVPIGATQGVGGGALQPNVDPSKYSLPPGSTGHVAIGSRGGRLSTVLMTSNMPPHSHTTTVNTSGLDNHRHTMFTADSDSTGLPAIPYGGGTMTNSMYYISHNSTAHSLNMAYLMAGALTTTPSVGLTSTAINPPGVTSSVTVTVNSAGGSNGVAVPIENRPPYLGFVWIVMLD